MVARRVLNSKSELRLGGESTNAHVEVGNAASGRWNLGESELRPSHKAQSLLPFLLLRSLSVFLSFCLSLSLSVSVSPLPPSLTHTPVG